LQEHKSIATTQVHFMLKMYEKESMHLQLQASGTSAITLFLFLWSTILCFSISPRFWSRGLLLAEEKSQMCNS